VVKPTARVGTARLQLRADLVEEVGAVVADVVDGRGDRACIEVPVGGLAEESA
jgi:hypothetical protein